MPIGTRNPEPAPPGMLLHGTGVAGSGFGAGGPGGGCGCGNTRRLVRLLSARSQVITLGTITFPAAVATLPTPNPGETYIIERAIIATNGSPAVLECVGEIGYPNVVDIAENITSTYISQADGDSALRLQAGDVFTVIWANATDLAGCTARLQIRVET